MKDNTGTAESHLRRDPFGIPAFPFVVLLIYLPAILYMHKSRIWMRSLQLDGPVEILGYFQAELVFFIAVAIALSLHKALRYLSFGIITFLYFIDLFDWMSWSAQSRPFFITDIYRAIHLAIYYPEFITALSLPIKIKAAALLGFPLIALLMLHRNAMARTTRRHAAAIRGSAATAAALILVATPLLFSNVYHRHNTFALMAVEQIYDFRLQKLDVRFDDMKATFGLQTADDTQATDQQKPDILLFVIETSPYPLYPAASELLAQIDNPDFVRNAVVFEQHYTTYPGSDRAIFSLLTGKYPPTTNGSEWKRHINYGATLPNQLHQAGYRSYLLTTSPLSFYDDQLMYRKIDFQHMRDVEYTQQLRKEIGKKMVWDRPKLYAADETLITMALDTLQKHRGETPQQPYFMMLAPQSSHAPLECPPTRANPGTACSTERERLQANALWQFGLINRIIAALAAENRLANTIVVITGDHGLRSERESTLFKNPSLLHASTFHVPMIISSPLLGAPQKKVTHPTSHIDVTPSLLQLAGVAATPQHFHGRQLLDTTERTIYFLGGDYLPANGFHNRNGYFMENRSSSICRAGTEFDFTPPIPCAGDIRRHVASEILRLQAFLYQTYYTEAGQTPARRE